MALGRFRMATVALIVFNIVGSIVTWTAGLSKPGTSMAHAIAGGTEVTGPLVFIALWIGFAVMMRGTGRAAVVSIWLMTAFGVLFAFGDLTELFKKNIGVSAAKWHFILAADVVSLIMGLAVAVFGVMTIRESRRNPAFTGA
jgi:hypothetical protein